MRIKIIDNQINILAAQGYHGPSLTNILIANRGLWLPTEVPYYKDKFRYRMVSGNLYTINDCVVSDIEDDQRYGYAKCCNCAWYGYPEESNPPGECRNCSRRDELEYIFPGSMKAMQSINIQMSNIISKCFPMEVQ